MIAKNVNEMSIHGWSRRLLVYGTHCEIDTYKYNDRDPA